MSEPATLLDVRPLIDVQSIRDSARRQLFNGAVTKSYGVDRDVVLRLLNEALATEVVSVLSYKRQYFVTRSSAPATLSTTLQEHALHDQQHVDRLAERIVQLGGIPDFSPHTLVERSHAEYCDGT